MTLDPWIDGQLEQVESVLGIKDTNALRHTVCVRSLLLSHKTLLLRLRAAERFCVAARGLAQYKEPLHHVLNALDAWERLVPTQEDPHA